MIDLQQVLPYELNEAADSHSGRSEPPQSRVKPEEFQRSDQSRPRGMRGKSVILHSISRAFSSPTAPGARSHRRSRLQRFLGGVPLMDWVAEL